MNGDLISAYSWNPIPNTSLLMWELASSIADVSDLDWIAALGVLSDLGEKAHFPLIAEAKQKYGAVQPQGSYRAHQRRQEIVTL